MISFEKKVEKNFDLTLHAQYYHSSLKSRSIISSHAVINQRNYLSIPSIKVQIYHVIYAYQFEVWWFLVKFCAEHNYNTLILYFVSVICFFSFCLNKGRTLPSQCTTTKKLSFKKLKRGEVSY